MPDPTPDPLAAYLDEVRERWSKVAYVGLKPEVVPEPGPNPDWLPDVPRLLAALDAVLALADELVATEFPDDEPVGTATGAAMAATVEARVHDGQFIREAISAALLGKGESGA